MLFILQRKTIFIANIETVSLDGFYRSVHTIGGYEKIF